MSFIKYIIVSLLLFLTAGLSAVSASEPGGVSSDKVEIVVFVRDGCTHCKDEEAFLSELQKKRSDMFVSLRRLENEQDRAAWDEFTTRLGLSKVTPITVIGDRYIIGFDKSDTTGKDIVSLIDRAKSNSIKTDLSVVSADGGQAVAAACTDGVKCAAPSSTLVRLPLVGSIDTKEYSLFALSALLGFFDGFNPCAMWVLVTFLVILMQVGSRKRMLLIAGTFVLAEAVMYSLILTVWFKTWDFVRLDQIVTPLIGVLAIGGGIFFIREWRKKELECKVTDLKQRKKTHDRIKQLALAEFTIFTFLAILALAFSVNVIEFACSIGIPQAFTKILELNQLPLLQNVFFIGIYIFFYMIDDLIVFGIALWGIDKMGLTTKYSKLSNLIGGVVMILLGLMLLFRPSLLLF